MRGHTRALCGEHGKALYYKHDRLRCEAVPFPCRLTWEDLADGALTRVEVSGSGSVWIKDD